MKQVLIFISLFFFGLALYSIPEFGERENLGKIVNDEIDECSGLVESIKNRGVLWTHNDSGGENRIFAIGDDGSNKGVFYLKGVENRDWEDIELGPGPEEGVDYIYIADIGDNLGQYNKKYIYRIAEPSIPINQYDIIDTLNDASTITFTYPDGDRDAETLMLDPITKDIFILSKRDSQIRLYRLPYPHTTSDIIEAELANVLTFPVDPEEDKPYNYITSGDISLDGSEIIVKTYSNIFYWERGLGMSITETLSEIQPLFLPFNRTIDESQGEAICWNNYNDKGYFTLSEEKIVVNNIELNFPAQLYYYPRIVPVSTAKTSIPDAFILKQNFPNPFNPNTFIEYEIPSGQFVELTVFDKTGERITRLINHYQTAGKHQVEFNTSSLDFSITSGIYYYTIQYDGKSQTKSMVLIK